jgi:transcriptional regulator with XRE-family HTH domain
MTDSSPAVAGLHSRWHALCDVDRALAVQSIQREGTSLQKLAPLLNCSPSLLSRLLRAAQAPAADRASARRREISTRELARRAGIAGTWGTDRHPEAIAFEHERAAFQARPTITEWLEDEAVASADREQIIEQARTQLVEADRRADGWQESYLRGRVQVESSRPSRPTQDERGGHSIDWFAARLALCLLRQIPDERVHDWALELALDVRPHF